MCDHLLIPLADLPGPVPVGAPGAYDHSSGPRACVIVGHANGEVQALCERTGGGQWAVTAWPSQYWLDLSPPPLDAAGWPTRIDGLDVAAGMLARALGRGAYAGVRWVGISEGRYWLSADVGSYFVGRGGGADTYEIPALLEIDRADVLAPRLAMAAVFRARVWEANHG